MRSGTDETAGHAAVSGQLEPELYEWRLAQLTRAGYRAGRAHELASRADVDLHLACELLERGCAEETAFAILA